MGMENADSIRLHMHYKLNTHSFLQVVGELGDHSFLAVEPLFIDKKSCIDVRHSDMNIFASANSILLCGSTYSSLQVQVELDDH